MDPAGAYTADRAAALSGVPRSTIHWWARHDVLSGSPHVAHTRLETRAIAALAADGFDLPAIRRLYPYVAAPHIVQALDLEHQLHDNLHRRVA